MKRHIDAFAIGARLAALFLFAVHASAVTLPQGPAVFESSLQSRISSTDTQHDAGLDLDRQWRGASERVSLFTLDEGRNQAERKFDDLYG